MGIIESDKEKVHNLCKAAIELNHDDFKALIAKIDKGEPVVKSLCEFLERKREAL
jgi:hypothetical protein